MNRQCSKLLKKARNKPASLRFVELQGLCECVGLKFDRSKGSHFIYHHQNPSFSLSIQQTKDGRAKAFQVRQLLDLIEKHNLVTEE